MHYINRKDTLTNLGGEFNFIGNELGVLYPFSSKKIKEITQLLLSYCTGDNLLGYKIFGNSTQETRTSSNKYNSATITENKTILSNGSIIDSTLTNISDYIAIENEKQYTLSFDYTTLGSENDRSIAIYNSNQELISSLVYTPSDKEYMFTATNNGYVRISLDRNATDIQFEEGAKKDYMSYGATIPSPEYPSEIKSLGDFVTDSNDEHYGKYKIPVKVKSSVNSEANTVNIYLNRPLYKIGDYADTIDFETGKRINKVGKIVIDGTENYVKRTDVIDDNFTVYRNADYINGSSFISNGNGLSNYFKVVNYQQLNNNIRFIDNDYYGAQITIDNNIASTAAELKNWLSTHNTEVYYALAEETEENIELPAIPTNRGTTILEFSSEVKPSNMYVKYYATR